MENIEGLNYLFKEIFELDFSYSLLNSLTERN